MGSSLLLSIFALLLVSMGCGANSANESNFHQNYSITWGYDHVFIPNQNGADQEGEVQLSLDQASGAGFASKVSYGSGFFHMKMKIPDNNSTGVVTTFYLTSHTDNHDELDFELLGNNGPPYTLHTNIYANGQGGREQRFHLWFDPTKDFHSYQLLWNQYQIVFYVDNIPVRVFRNHTEIGLDYPSQPMHIEGSIWNGEGWASEGKKIEWSQAPFKAHYQGFNADGCISDDTNSQKCQASSLWWNTERYRKLNITQQQGYNGLRKYMYYDYCSDKHRYPITPPECQKSPVD